ncbi:antiviral reverse transcriptase Drt2 [Hymenobacter baengnokdamensis]|uniref:antiviral reverse transcriptase Drt2 n=1 Tax=Hymenobacter baengnokdamensis TaxID=2615203 RepID=UPI001248142F|nr:antiviral reverse transcriptase Drt2 [Hymenobacter baengnokdamensis]
MADDALFVRWEKQLLHRQRNQALYSPKVEPSSSGKQYLHFDFAISKDELDEWKPFLLDPEHVRKRAFYPFLKMVKLRKRYKKGDDGVRRPAPPKPREICYASHHDALFYSWYGFQLEDLLETRLQEAGLDECVLAYRGSKGRNNLHFAKEVFDYVAAQPCCVALAFDVTKFFDTLNHRILKDAWLDLLIKPELPRDHYTIFKAMTRFRFIQVDQLKAVLGEEFKRCKKRKRLVYPKQFRKQLLPLQETNDAKKGIPQGAPLSAVLSNLYMMQADMVLQKFAKANHGIYRRYCDDLLLVLPIGTEHTAEALVRAELTKLDLELNEGKTERRFFTTTFAGELECRDEKCDFLPLQYLGLEYCGKDIRIRASSLARYHQRMRRGVRKAVRKAKGPGGKNGGKVYKRKLYERFTHLGESNFITYAQGAYKVTKSEALKRQCSGSVERVHQVIQEEEARHRTRRSSGVLGGAGHRRVGFN